MFRETGDWGEEARSDDARESRGTTAAADPVGRYLTEAARTPLLDKPDERRLAQTMARRRAMFISAACAVPEAWPGAVALVMSVVRGERGAMKTFDIGGLSQRAFHAHVDGLRPAIRRLRELCETSELSRDAYVEGRDIMRALRLRIGVLHRLLRAVEVRDDFRFGRARAVYRAFVEARNALVSANLRLVVHVAKQVARHPSQILELIQEGNVGLLYATEKYDARETCQFHSYAFWWIKQSMTRAIGTKFRLIRQPIHLDEAPQHIRDAVKKFRDKEGRDPTPYELADMLDISRAQAQRIFRASVHCLSLDQMQTDDDSPLSKMLAAASEEPRLDRRSMADGMTNVLASLSPREREVVQLRFGLGHDDPYTLEDIARIYNLSRERVRQIELKAIEKLRHPSRARRLRALLDAM